MPGHIINSSTRLCTAVTTASTVIRGEICSNYILPLSHVCIHCHDHRIVFLMCAFVKKLDFGMVLHAIIRYEVTAVHLHTRVVTCYSGRFLLLLSDDCQVVENEAVDRAS